MYTVGVRSCITRYHSILIYAPKHQVPLLNTSKLLPSCSSLTPEEVRQEAGPDVIEDRLILRDSIPFVFELCTANALSLPTLVPRGYQYEESSGVQR